MFPPHPRVKVSIVGSLRDRELACSASDRQGLNFESCGPKPDLFHFISYYYKIFNTTHLVIALQKRAARKIHKESRLCHRDTTFQ